MSYPTKLHLFKKWARAMEEGATVKEPNYGKSTSTGGKTRRKRRPQRKRIRRMRKKED